jgi:uncharacterized membrane protein (UPF0127 family)|tara:strand:+ start:158 stop:607 length:450 start_codon:yes stop_codon:yes gene_type:complete
MSKLLKLSALKLFSLTFLFLFFISAESKETIDLQKYLTHIEIAKDYQDRKIGLMFRDSLADNRGMFFIWDRKKIQCMWMKNTLIPLSVAYISDTGEIINVYDMVPLSKISVCSKEPALYALEVNKGWFNKNDIHSGDFINIKKLLQNDD